MHVVLENINVTSPTTFSSFKVTPIIYSHPSPPWRHTTDSLYEKWTHIKVGYHSDSTFTVNEKEYNGFVDTVYRNQWNSIRHQIDFLQKLRSFNDRTHKKIFSSDEKFKFRVYNKWSDEVQTYLRDLVVFRDFVRTNFEDFRLNEVFKQYWLTYFYLPMNDVLPSPNEWKLEMSMYTREVEETPKQTLSFNRPSSPSTDHPLSWRWHRLNLYEPNQRMRTLYFEKENYTTCKTEWEMCIDHLQPQSLETVLCQNWKAIAYDDMESAPVKAKCVTICPDNQLCTNLCHSWEENCFVTNCKSETERWFDNQCIDMKNSDFY